MGFGMAGTGNIVNLKPIKKGERRVGRKPGTPNKTTQILKDALLDAATAVGFPMEVTLLDDDGVPTDIIKLKKTGKDGMQGDKTALSYWFPKLVEAGIPLPKTKIIHMPEKAQKVIWKWFDGKAGDDATELSFATFIVELQAAPSRRASAVLAASPARRTRPHRYSRMRCWMQQQRLASQWR
jgi:hypothetical protein